MFYNPSNPTNGAPRKFSWCNIGAVRTEQDERIIYIYILKVNFKILYAQTLN